MVKTNSESDLIPRREIDSVDDKTEENLKFENLKGGTVLRIDGVGGRINLGERRKELPLREATPSLAF